MLNLNIDILNLEFNLNNYFKRVKYGSFYILEYEILLFVY